MCYILYRITIDCKSYNLQSYILSNTSLNNLKNSLGECAYQNFFNDWNSYDNNHTVPRIRGDGVMEIGQYIDMHTVGHNTDYDKRIST